MKRIKKTLTAGILKALLSTLILCTTTSVILAATIDWKGSTNLDWGTASNWSSGSVPLSTDAVRIGVVTFINQPTVGLGETATIASLTFGGLNNITLTIAGGCTIAVTGAIVQNPSSFSYGNLTTTITGAGTLTCATVSVGNTYTFPPVLAYNLLEVISSISNFHITNGIAINSTNFGVLFVGIGYNNAEFSLQGGNLTIDGQILTANTSSGVLPSIYAAPKFSIDIPSGSSLSPVLQLTNQVPINPASVAATIDFYNNTGGTGTSTVYYDGTTQEVFANNTASLDNNPQTYQYLQLTGSGTKTVDAGTLTVGNNLTSSTASVLFNTNNAAAAIGGNWTNSSNVTQGSGNITIGGTVTNNSGGTLNLGPGNLSIAGNYTNSVGGVYSQSSGTTYFNGSGAQALVDNSTTGTLFKLVGFNGGGTATMSAGTNNANFSVAATGILTMSNSSKLIAGSSSSAYLTLISDTTGAATVAAIPSGCSISGYVTVQRFVQGSAVFDALTNKWLARNYRLLSSAVNEGADGSGNYPYSLNYLGAKTIVTDCTSSYSSTGGNPSLYLYNEHYTPSNASYISGNFIGVTNISSTSAAGNITTTDASNGSAKIYAGDGFMMYFRGDKITHITGTPNKTTYPYVAPESVTFSSTGNLNQGTYSVVSWTGYSGLLYSTNNAGNTAARGFNLVGNPYASSINWSTFSNTNTAAAIYGKNVNPTVYLFNPKTSNYDTYNATTNIATGSAGKIIPSGQGFFVQANSSAPTLTFNETSKSNTGVSGSNLLMGAPNMQTAYNSFIRLKLIADSNNYHDMVIGFNSSSSTKFNPVTDSQFLPGLGSMGTISAITSDSIKTSVKWLPLPGDTVSQVIKLNVNARASGLYTIQRTDIKAIPPIFEIWLMDNYLKDSLDVRNNPAYAFNVDLNDTSSFGSNRFTMVVRQDPALAIHLLNFSAAKTQAGSKLVWQTENEQNYTNFSVERKSSSDTTFSSLASIASSAQGTYSFMDKDPATGTNSYRVRIQDLNGIITYTNVITLMYSNTNALAKSNIDIYPNPAVGVINLAVNQSAATSLPGISTLQTQGLTPALTASPVASSHAYDIKIMSITGSVVKSEISASSLWQDDVSTLTPGTYIIQVLNNNDKSLVGKSTFVKM